MHASCCTDGGPEPIKLVCGQSSKNSIAVIQIHHQSVYVAYMKIGHRTTVTYRLLLCYVKVGHCDQVTYTLLQVHTVALSKRPADQRTGKQLLSFSLPYHPCNDDKVDDEQTARVDQFYNKKFVRDCIIPLSWCPSFRT